MSKAVLSLVWKLIRGAVAVGFSVLASPWDPWYGTILTNTGCACGWNKPLRAPRAGAGNFTPPWPQREAGTTSKKKFENKPKEIPRLDEENNHKHCRPSAKILWCWQTCSKSLFLVFLGKTEPSTLWPKRTLEGFSSQLRKGGKTVECFFNNHLKSIANEKFF